MFKVVYKKKVKESVDTMPKAHKIRFRKLVKDLERKGPVLSDWPNYSLLRGTNTHHCHLSYKWVACWVETLKGIEIEVTYAGSRESSPYA